MTQNNHTQSKNQHFQHENQNEKSKDWVKVFQSWIETNNQFYMIIKEWKSIKKQTCIDDFNFQNRSRSTKIFEKVTFNCEINISNSRILRLLIKWLMSKMLNIQAFAEQMQQIIKMLILRAKSSDMRS